MKVYIVFGRDLTEWDGERFEIDVCSTREMAEQSGKHYCEYHNNEYHEGNEVYKYTVHERELDNYYVKHLSPLAKALK